MRIAQIGRGDPYVEAVERKLGDEARAFPTQVSVLSTDRKSGKNKERNPLEQCPSLGTSRLLVLRTALLRRTAQCQSTALGAQAEHGCRGGEQAQQDAAEPEALTDRAEACEFTAAGGGGGLVLALMHCRARGKDVLGANAQEFDALKPDNHVGAEVAGVA